MHSNDVICQRGWLRFEWAGIGAAPFPRSSTDAALPRTRRRSADFERGAVDLLGMPPRAFKNRSGIGAFWRELGRHPDFYGTLPLMPDAMQLFEAVRHLDPIILTGLPRGKWAAPQKVRWAAEHFPGTQILTVMAVDKRNHALEGDILVDDQLKHAHLWEGAGGIFVHHGDAASTLAELRGLGVPVNDPKHSTRRPEEKETRNTDGD